MNHADPYISTTEIQELVAPEPATPKQAAPAQGYYNSDATRAEGRRLGAVLMAIPVFDMIGFAFKGMFAFFMASAVYTFLLAIVLMIAFGGPGGMRLMLLRMLWSTQ